MGLVALGRPDRVRREARLQEEVGQALGRLGAQGQRGEAPPQVLERGLRRAASEATALEAVEQPGVGGDDRGSRVTLVLEVLDRGVEGRQEGIGGGIRRVTTGGPRRRAATMAPASAAATTPPRASTAQGGGDEGDSPLSSDAAGVSLAAVTSSSSSRFGRRAR